MLRVSLFLLLSLALHGAGWLLYGTAEAPALTRAQASAAPQVLRLAALLQQSAPQPARLPEQMQAQPQAPRRVESLSDAQAPEPVAPTASPRAVATPAKPHAAPTLASAPAQAASSAAAKPVSAQPVAEVLSRAPSFRQPPRPPRYPAQARRRNQQGLVLVEVRLDARGQQRSLHVVHSSGVDSLDRAALDAVSAWRFRPESANGRAVPSRVQIPIQFALTASR